jgi:hypothetical protein
VAIETNTAAPEVARPKPAGHPPKSRAGAREPTSKPAGEAARALALLRKAQLETPF